MAQIHFFTRGDIGARDGHRWFGELPILGQDTKPVFHRPIVALQLAAGNMVTARGYKLHHGEPSFAYDLSGQRAEALAEFFEHVNHGEPRSDITSGSLVRAIMGWEVDPNPDNTHLGDVTKRNQPDRPYAVGDPPYYVYSLGSIDGVGVVDTSGGMALIQFPSFRTGLGATVQMAEIV